MSTAPDETSPAASSAATAGTAPSSAKPSSTKPSGTVPPTYLVAAIAVTVLCFLPLGVIAVVYALRTADAISDGDIELAQQSSRLAKRWVRIALAAGLAVWALLLAVFLLLGAFG